MTPGVKTVILQMKCQPDARYSVYRVAIETASGQSLLTQENLQAQGNVLRLSLPAQRLHTEDYLLTLSGKTTRREYEEISDYSFRVVKK